MIKIKGHPRPQSLPMAMTKSWPVWTCDLENKANPLTLVEGEEQGAWVNPTSYESLFLPSDLPLPNMRHALGVALANGVPRYIMPSIVLTLETPAAVWRNRGVASLPRANSWIDLFAAFSPQLSSLRLSTFGQIAREVRFLEDQDGSAAWQSITIPGSPQSSPSIMRPENWDNSYEITKTFDMFRSLVAEDPQFECVRDGYHFVDIPLLGSQSFRMPAAQRLKQYITDIEDPKRLIGIEDATMLEEEPCGELDISVQTISPGSKSKFLPEVSSTHNIVCLRCRSKLAIYATCRFIRYYVTRY
jgi:hypothetical protein